MILCEKTIALLAALVMLVFLCACSPAPSYKGATEELDVILEMISEIPIATMGVFVPIAMRSVELLDWCEATTMTDEELADYAKNYHDGLDAAAQELFAEQVSAVAINGVGNLTHEESRAAVLESAGVSKTRSWDEETMALAMCIDDRL